MVANCRAGTYVKSCKKMALLRTLKQHGIIPCCFKVRFILVTSLHKGQFSGLSSS
jgi:hypothetical protein